MSSMAMLYTNPKLVGYKSWEGAAAPILMKDAALVTNYWLTDGVIINDANLLF